MIEQIEEVWLEHIPDFPFHMSIGDVSQFIVENEEEFLYYVYNALGKDVFVAVHNTEDRELEIYRTIYLDIDNDNPANAIKDLAIIIDFLREIEYDFRVYFSGRKGFSVYIDFKPTHIKRFKEKLKIFIDDLMEYLDIPNLDRNVCIDVKRISRLPYTINTKSGVMCHPIDINTDFWSLSIKDVGFTSKVIAIKRSTSNKEFGEILNEAVIPVEYVECIVPNINYISELVYLLENAKKLIAGVRHHAVRLKIIPTLIQMGYNDSYIIQECAIYYNKVFGKFSYTDQSWVTAQIRGCRNKNLKPIRLDNFASRYGVKGNIGL